MLWIVGDDNRDRTSRPVVTWLLILANILIFFLLQDSGKNHEFTSRYVTVPAEIVEGRDIVTTEGGVLKRIFQSLSNTPRLGKSPRPIYLTLITGLFLHAGWLHLLGNMLFLFVFGDNVEDRMGKVRFLLYYLLFGVAASAGHILQTYATGADPIIPLLGASGAVSGVLGAYLIFFPRKRVVVLMWIIIIFRRWRVRAIYAIGTWFLFQLLSGYRSILGGGGRVAYSAHIAGFVCGLLLAIWFRVTHRRRDVPSVTEV